MRQTQLTSNQYYRLIVVSILVLACTGMLFAQSTAFQDLPADHWAFSDVDFLVSRGYMDGYPDGTFKGRKVTTRYDLALVLARVLQRMEERKETIDSATEQERAALTRLTREFRDELGLLDVRVDSIERRMIQNENQMRDLENRLPRVRISGFYRGRGQYIIDPETAKRNEWGDPASFEDPGLVTFYQQLYLRFTGQPPGDRITAFYELYGFIAGATWNRLIYNDAGKTGGPNPFDNIDDYVERIQNDQFIKTNKMHLISNARSMRLRVFAGESVTGLDNPMNLLTENTGVVYPYQGVEVSGSEGGVSYQGSILKGDLRHGSDDDTNMITGRLLWELPEQFSEDSLSIGTTYAERIFDYKTPGNTNAVRALDLNYSTDRIGRFLASAEFLRSDTYLRDTEDNEMRALTDRGTTFDMSIQSGGLLGTVKHYDFGRNFRASMAPPWAYDIGSTRNYPRDLSLWDNNYGRYDFEGEKLTRFGVNYDFEDKLFSIANNFSVEATYLSKTWEEDPNNPKPTDDHSGRKMTFQLLSDFTDNTTLKYDFIHHWDALEDIQGWKSNAVELNLRLNDSVSTKGKIFVKNDPDRIFDDRGDEYKYSERIGYFEINSDINPRVYVKGSVEHQVNWSNTPKENTRVDYIAEATYNLTPSTSFTGGIQHVDYEDSWDSSNSSLANAILAELRKNFTDRFRGRAFYVRGVIDYKDGNTDSIDRENIYAELIYDVSRDALISFRYGYNYPDLWRWDITSTDNGRAWRDVHTQKMLLFEARTNF